MRLRSLVGLLAALLTPACAALPTLPSERGVNVYEIVHATKCELRSVLSVAGHSLAGWSAKVSLDLRTLYDNSGGPNGSVIVPYYAGTVEAVAGFGGAAQSNRVGHLGYVVQDLRDLDQLVCAEYATGEPFAPAGLGLGYWLKTAVQSVNRDVASSLSELTYTLEFVVELTASGTARIRPVTTPTTGLAEIGGKASAKDTHTLLVSLVPPSPRSGPTLVKIVSWPNLTAVPGAVEVAPRPSVKQGSKDGTKRGNGVGPLRQAPPASAPARAKVIDPSTLQRLDDLQVKQRLFNSITVPRSTLNAF